MSDHFDLAVVGGGVIGLGIAFEAGRRGLRAVVLSRDEAGAATPAAGGMLSPAAEAGEIPPPLAAFALESCRAYPAFVEAVETIAQKSCGYRADGTILVALHRDHWAEFEHLAAQQRAAGLRADPITAAELREREPYVSPRQQGGLWLRDDHQVNPRRLHAALAVAVVKLGGAILPISRVCGLEWESERVRGLAVERTGVEVKLVADAVVLAAGAWSKEAIAEVPVLPLRPVRGQIVRLRGPDLITRVIRTPSVYLVPRDEGEMLLGAVSEAVGFDLAPRAGAVLELLREAWAVVPGVAEHAFLETTVGFRPALRDNMPAIGAFGGGLFVATGHYRHGIMLTPITARLLVDEIISGVPSPGLAAFLPGRFGGECP